MDWSTWVQNVSAGLIDKAASAQYVQPYEIQKLQLEALGQTGYYREGQAGTIPPVGGGLAISGNTLLLIGAAVLAVMLMRD